MLDSMAQSDKVSETVSEIVASNKCSHRGLCDPYTQGYVDAIDHVALIIDAATDGSHTILRSIGNTTAMMHDILLDNYREIIEKSIDLFKCATLDSISSDESVDDE